MSDRLLELVGEARARWMIGAPGASGDHPLLEGVSPAETDLRLLAIAGQHRLIHCRPRPPDLSVVPEFPAVALPLLEEALRPLLKRALALNSEARHGIAVAALVASRGRMLHPLDWTPPANPAGLPAPYREVWIWTQHPGKSLPTLSVEAWPEIPATLQPALLEELWARSPDQARGILQGVFAARPAEERLALLEVLARSPAPEDIPFLEGLESDRSGKVKVLARRVRGRLGQAVPPGEAATEAATFFEVQKVGLLRRKTERRIRKGLSPAQQRSLQTALAETSLSELAGALGTTPGEFCSQWSANACPPSVLVLLAEIVAASGRPEESLTFLRGSDVLGNPLQLFAHLLPRLRPAEAAAIIAQNIDQVGSAGATLLKDVFGHDLPSIVLQALLGSKVYRDLSKLAARVSQSQDQVERRRAEHELHPLLNTFSFLLPSFEAQGLLDRLVASGLHPADPRLSLLSLNASLKG